MDARQTYLISLLGLHDKLPMIGCLNNSNLFSRDSEAKSPRSKCQHGWFVLSLSPSLADDLVWPYVIFLLGVSVS